jgi:hypothetical protein
MLPILLLLPTLLFAATPKEISEAKKSIQSLIRPLLPGSDKKAPKEMGNFHVDECEKQKINWMDVLLMKSKPTLVYKFKEGCDIQGTIEPKIFQSFPAALELRHMESYNHIQTQNKVMASFETKPLMNLEMRSGELKGKKGLVKFEADYSVRINPMDKKNIVEENKGGEIRISEIYGEKVSIKENIKIE